MSDHTTPVELPEPVTVELVGTGRLLLVVVIGLLIALLLTLAGIIWLAIIEKNAPDVLVVTAGTIVGALAGMVMPAFTGSTGGAHRL